MENTTDDIARPDASDRPGAPATQAQVTPEPATTDTPATDTATTDTARTRSTPDPVATPDPTPDPVAGAVPPGAVGPEAPLAPPPPYAPWTPEPSSYSPPPPPAGSRFTLRRSRTDRMLGGVCGGLAKSLDVDAALLRVGLVALTLVGFGLGAVIYIAVWILAPVDDSEV